MHLVVDIGLDVGLVFEGEDPHVGEAFIEVFFADVGSPFERLDLGDGAFEGGERGFDAFDLFGGGLLLELEGDDVLDAVFSEDCGGAHEKGREDGEKFHVVHWLIVRLVTGLRRWHRPWRVCRRGLCLRYGYRRCAGLLR